MRAKDIMYDFRRTFTGRYTIIAMLLIILVAAGAAYLVTLNGVLPRTNLDLVQRSFSEFDSISGVMIPILASFSSYFYFGKDKANNVLESIITLPVTRGRLISSRYLANVSSMLVAFAIGAGVFELILFEDLGQYLSLHYLLFLIWVYFVEISAFTGLVYLASQYIDSQAAILGFVIGLFLIFGVFWNSDITYLVLHSANISTGSNMYIQDRLYFNVASPGGYAPLSSFFLVPSNSTGETLNAASFGVTPFVVYLVGILWALVPILLGIAIGRKRD